jgi:hypothetical protein
MQSELRRITLQIAQDLSKVFDAYLKDKITAEKLGHSILDMVESMIDKVAKLHDIDAETLYKAMRMACGKGDEDDDEDDEDDDLFGLGGDWWKHGKTD